MSALQNVKAPSSVPQGMLGVGGRTARITLTTAQGGMAHFISESATLETLDGKHLGDLGNAGVQWSTLRDAILDGTATWTTTQGAHGSSSSTIKATIDCKQVVAPSAKPTCTVMPEPVN